MRQSVPGGKIAIVAAVARELMSEIVVGLG